MRNKLLLSSMLLCAMWVVAQTSPNSSSSQSSNSNGQMPTSSQTSSQSSDNGNGSEMTVRGCLSGSSGNYTLTSDSGTTYQLAGDTSKLSDHVGHEIEVKGTTSPSSSSSSSGTMGSSGSSGSSSGGTSQQTLNVTSMKHIATSCSSK